MYSNIDALPMGKILQPSQGNSRLKKLRMPGPKKQKSKITVQPAE